MADKIQRDYLLEQHRPFIKDLHGDVSVKRASLKLGDYIVFFYEGETKYLFVVAPYWRGKLHGIDLRRIPRLDFMRFANLTFSRLTPKTLYDRYLSKQPISKYQAYRTYDWGKISLPKYLEYNTTVQPDEEETANIPDPKEDADGVIL